jgi:hypothetical protein
VWEEKLVWMTWRSLGAQQRVVLPPLRRPVDLLVVVVVVVVVVMQVVPVSMTTKAL